MATPPAPPGTINVSGIPVLSLPLSLYQLRKSPGVRAWQLGKGCPNGLLPWVAGWWFAASSCSAALPHETPVVLRKSCSGSHLSFSLLLEQSSLWAEFTYQGSAQLSLCCNRGVKVSLGSPRQQQGNEGLCSNPGVIISWSFRAGTVIAMALRASSDTPNAPQTTASAPHQLPGNCSSPELRRQQQRKQL